MINIENDNNNIPKNSIFILLSIILFTILGVVIYIKKDELQKYIQDFVPQKVEKNNKSLFPNELKREKLSGENYITEFTGNIVSINQTIENGVYITFLDETKQQNFDVKVSDGLTKKLSFMMEKRNNFYVKCKMRNEKFIFQCDIYTQ